MQSRECVGAVEVIDLAVFRMARRVDSEVDERVARKQVFPVGIIALPVDAVADRRKEISVVAGIADGGGRHLLEPGLTAGVLRPGARLVQRRQQHAGEDRDDRDDDEEFDKGENPFFHEGDSCCSWGI